MKRHPVNLYKLTAAIWVYIAVALNAFVQAQATNYTPLFTNATFVKTVNVTLSVGTVAASADASNGGASYTIPIVVPPGTNGVAPEISVAYNSFGGNGPLGQGWGIAGLSMITRSSRSIYFDTYANAVDLTANDRFALDGMRLIGKTGTYGADLATYGTESENFATVTSYGSMGGGPLWLKVVTKDGMTMEYGNTTDSRFLNHDNTKVLFWRLNKILYNDGNYIEFKYNNSDGDSRIDEINYTGNAGAGLLPYNKLKFNYSVRTEVTTTYEAQTPMVSKYLLDNITVTAETSAAFKTYTFKYGFNNVTSFLKEVIEAGSSGSALNSTIFKYGEQPTDFQTTSSGVVAGQSVDLFSGDFDADGYSDILAATYAYSNSIKYHTEFKIYKRTATNSTFSLAATQALPVDFTVVNKMNVPSSYNFFASDFSGDGADDIITVHTSLQSYGRKLEKLRLFVSNNATSFTTYDRVPQPNYNRIHSSGNFFFPGDFNGDGIAESITLLGNSLGNYGAYLCNNSLVGGACGSISNSGSYNFATSTWASADKVYVLDFNGDGKSDLMVIKDGTCEIFTLDGYNAKSIYLSGFPTKWHQLYFGDFNGDRKTDILSRTSTTNINAPWYKSMSTGKTFVETPFTFSHTPDITNTYSDDKLVIADFNGDGKMDILLGWNYFSGGVATDSRLDMYYSKGDNFYYQQHYFGSLLGFVPLISYDLNGDGRSELVNRNYYQDPFTIFQFKKEGKELLLEKAKNGFDHTTEWVYKRMTETGTGGSFYNRGVLTAHPVNTVQMPLYLVQELKSQNGIGGNTTLQYAYEEAKVHKEGKGLLGMKKTTVNNLATGMKIVLENEFNTTFYAAAPYKTSTYLASTSSLLNEVTLTNEFVNLGSKRYWYRANSSYNNKAFEGRFVSSSNTYDTYGNVTQNTTNNNNVETTVTTTAYGAFGTPVPAKPTSVAISRTRTGQSAYSLTTTFAYNAIGKVTSKTDFSGQAQNVATSYTYNNMGNRTGVTVTPASMTARTETSTYDSKGRFALTTTNPLGQTSSATYDAKWGKPLSVIGVDGLTTGFNYDAYGRLQTTIMPQGWIITEAYAWDINTTEGTVHYRYTGHTGKPDVKVWYDILNREKKKQTEGFQNLWVTEKKTYDARGNVVTSTVPYKSGESQLTIYNTYDTYNRLTAAASTLGTTSYAYAYASGNLTLTTTNPAAQVSSKVTDATGKAVSATDNGGTLNYTYNSQGNLTQVKLGTVTMVTNEYDIYGRQTKLIDLNAGNTQYAYNSLGELTSQINPKVQTHTMQYDLLGRNTQRTGPEGTTTYEYFPTGTAAANQVKKITGFTGNLEEFTYDTYGRLSTVKETIDAVANTTSYGYNTYSDLTSTTYPSGFGVNNAYDANGYLTTVKNSANTITLFTNTGMNGFNQYTGFTLGNGKATTNTYYFGTPTRYFASSVQDLNLAWNYQSGNLTSRNDAIKGRTESFTYDNLNRLLTSTVTGQSAITMTYAANGNINSKTDVGNYAYYVANTNKVDWLSNPSSVIPGAFQTVTYTAFDQPNVITEGIYDLTFTYGADYERRKTVLKQSGVVTETRYFFDTYEKRVAGATTQHIHYISGGDGLNAIVVRENGTDTYYYTYTDHLGSILTVTNSAGTVVTEQNFDAWGRGRNPSTWTYASVPTPPVWLYRGYTGHEHLPQFSLINMNGRLYDPNMARMLSPDNYVQNPLFSQTYNRYSYALNNPLRFTDPNGEIVWFIPVIIGAVIGAYSGGVIANGGEYNPGKWDYSSGKTWGYMIGGAIVGGISGGVGGAIASSGIPLANTAAIVAGSFINSVGMNIVTGGQTSMSLSFGFGSYNFTTGEFGYLGKKGNKWYENLAYGLGALANISDALAGFKPQEVQLNTEHSDAIGHSALTEVGEADPYNSLVSVGPSPDANFFNPFDAKLGDSNWHNYVDAPANEVWQTVVKGVNLKRIQNYGAHLDGNVRYNLYFSSCVSHTARALTLSGVPTIGIHPFILHAQIYLRSIGVRPGLFMYHFDGN